MIKNPIPKVSSQTQSRAIGIIFGKYKPYDPNLLNKGVIQDVNGFNIESVVLGKALPLIKKYINFEKNYYWIVYPRNKNSNNLHLQITGIWDPNNFKVSNKNNIEKTHDLLRSFNLKEDMFSIRGKLIFINIQKEELILKISCSKANNPKVKSFKIFVKGVIQMKFINSFVSLELTRKDNSLFLDHFEVIDEKISVID